jgi:signal transduction histidine kinase/CheY-like chemotaxis protein
MIRNPNNQVYKTVVLVWISLSVASVILSGITWYQLRNQLRSSKEAEAIHNAVENVLASLLDAETSQRGYTISGSDDFLRPFAKAITNLPKQFDHLAELSRNDSNTLQRVMELRAQAELSMAYHRKVVELRQQQGRDPAADLVAKGEGKAIMDAIRERVAHIASTRSDLTSSKGIASRGQLLRAELTSLITGIIGVGAGFFAFYLARVSARHMEREHELLEAKLRAERESQEKSTFLANMSHEIRTPMNAILGFSELLSGEVRDSRQRQYLQSIRTSAASLLQLINDILDMSKVEAGVIELRPDPTDPREVCEFIRTVFSGPAAQRGVKLECHVAEDLPRALLLDRVRLRQVLVNLVGNAVKFTDHGRIDTTVTWEKQANSSSSITLIIEVQDTGVGIPKDKLDAIFQPFVQAGAHRDKEKTGAGLGLSIVQRLVQLMGGTITVASIVGQGSAFHLRFPDVPVSVRLPTTDQPDADEVVNFNELKPARILVVDDNEMNCRLLAGMFEGSHHQLEFGANGQEAVAKAQSFRPHAVLMDMRMPNMGGREALVEIRKNPGLELVPVIAVTASSLMDDEKESREKFSAYLRKPFTRRELYNELVNFLPRATRTGNTERLTTLPSNGPVSTAQGWSRLSKQLRGLETKEWPAVRDGLAMSEAHRFAGKLEKLARETNCEPLLTYSEALVHYADSYAVDALEKHLQEFPDLIERIESSGT